jgi:hypothetical protein
MAEVVAGAGAGFHWMSLETRKGSSEAERDLEKAVDKLMIIASGERQHDFLRLRRWPDVCCCCLPSSFWEY